jgi:hypothetical protein
MISRKSTGILDGEEGDKTDTGLAHFLGRLGYTYSNPLGAFGGGWVN